MKNYHFWVIEYHYSFNFDNFSKKFYRKIMYFHNFINLDSNNLANGALQAICEAVIQRIL